MFFFIGDGVGDEDMKQRRDGEQNRKKKRYSCIFRRRRNKMENKIEVLGIGIWSKKIVL